MEGQALTVVSLNVDGLKSNAAYVGDLLTRYDILLLQEHWLHSYEQCILQKMFPNATATVKCYDDALMTPP